MLISRTRKCSLIVPLWKMFSFRILKVLYRTLRLSVQKRFQQKPFRISKTIQRTLEENKQQQQKTLKSRVLKGSLIVPLREPLKVLSRTLPRRVFLLERISSRCFTMLRALNHPNDVTKLSVSLESLRYHRL